MCEREWGGVNFGSKLAYLYQRTLKSTRFSEVTSDNSWMSYSSRTETYGHRVRLLTDTSTYLHQDVGYGIPSRATKAQDIQRTFITPERHRHVSITIGVSALPSDSAK